MICWSAATNSAPLGCGRPRLDVAPANSFRPRAAPGGELAARCRRCYAHCIRAAAHQPVHAVMKWSARQRRLALPTKPSSGYQNTSTPPGLQYARPPARRASSMLHRIGSRIKRKSHEQIAVAFSGPARHTSPQRHRRALTLHIDELAPTRKLQQLPDCPKLASAWPAYPARPRGQYGDAWVAESAGCATFGIGHRHDIRQLVQRSQTARSGMARTRLSPVSLATAPARPHQYQHSPPLHDACRSPLFPLLPPQGTCIQHTATAGNMNGKSATVWPAIRVTAATRDKAFAACRHGFDGRVRDWMRLASAAGRRYSG